jgi:hypothetical protein
MRLEGACQPVVLSSGEGHASFSFRPTDENSTTDFVLVKQ